jgi:hypothetical protein
MKKGVKKTFVVVKLQSMNYQGCPITFIVYSALNGNVDVFKSWKSSE